MPKPPAASTIRRVVDHLTETGDLYDYGLHADDECTHEAETVEEELAAFVGELHRQAHPDQPRMVIACRREPCRSLAVHHYPTIATA